MDGSESRPILFQIPKGLFSWKINTFTSTLSQYWSFHIIFSWSTECSFNLLIQLVLFLESFPKLYLKVFVLFFFFCPNSSALYFRNTIYVFAGHVFLCLAHVLFPTPISHVSFISIIFVPFLFLSSMGSPVLSVTDLSTVLSVTWPSFLWWSEFFILSFLFLLLWLPLSVFSELL